jgi:hypothetical protein
MSDFETTSLHRITELPIDGEAEFFRHYPAFKLGVTESVRYYARLLLPILKNTLSSDARHNDWILTGPALAAETPAGANLLCWELFDLFKVEQDSQKSNELSLINIKYDNESTAAIDYAKLGFAERVAERQRLNRRLVDDHSLRGRAVLFVNDICVTRAQQHAMQMYFEQNHAAKISWLYLIVVDPEIGMKDPKIEWQINFVSFKDLLRMVSREQIQFTGKCLLKVMHLSLEELDQVMRVLSQERRIRLLDLAVLNGFQNLEEFREQIELVRSYVETKKSPEIASVRPRVTLT